MASGMSSSRLAWSQSRPGLRPSKPALHPPRSLVVTKLCHQTAEVTWAAGTAGWGGCCGACCGCSLRSVVWESSLVIPKEYSKLKAHFRPAGQSETILALMIPSLYPLLGSWHLVSTRALVIMGLQTARTCAGQQVCGGELCVWGQRGSGLGSSTECWGPLQPT